MIIRRRCQAVASELSPTILWLHLVLGATLTILVSIMPNAGHAYSARFYFYALSRLAVRYTIEGNGVALLSYTDAYYCWLKSSVCQHL